MLVYLFYWHEQLLTIIIQSSFPIHSVDLIPHSMSHLLKTFHQNLFVLLKGIILSWRLFSSSIFLSIFYHLWSLVLSAYCNRSLLHYHYSHFQSNFPEFLNSLHKILRWKVTLSPKFEIIQGDSTIHSLFSQQIGKSSRSLFSHPNIQSNVCYLSVLFRSFEAFFGIFQRFQSFWGSKRYIELTIFVSKR